MSRFQPRSRRPSRHLRSVVDLRPALAASLALAVLVPCTGCQTGSSGAKADTRSVVTLFSPPTPQQAAAWAVDPYDADKRQRGLLLLANAPWGGEDVYVDLYEAALTDADAGVRVSAIKALGLHGRPEHAPMIAAELGEEDRLVRWGAARALQRIHNPEVVPALIERLDPATEADFDVRAAAATALGQYAQNRVLDALVGALNDPNLLVNRAAEGSLRTLTGRDFGEDVRAWVAWTAESDAPFADRKPYEYPVFNRDRTFLEWIVPFMEPPNEVAAAPAGMPASQMQAKSDTSAERVEGSVRQN